MKTYSELLNESGDSKIKIYNNEFKIINSVGNSINFVKSNDNIYVEIIKEQTIFDTLVLNKKDITKLIDYLM